MIIVLNTYLQVNYTLESNACMHFFFHSFGEAERDAVDQDEEFNMALL